MKEIHKKLIGQTFGVLTIKNIIPYYTKNRPNQRGYNAEVYCDACKNTKFLRLRSIIENHAKSCGCLTYKNKPRGLDNKKCIDIRGKKFGMLSPVVIDSTKKDRVYWTCLCDCGNYKSVATKHLVGNHITSCGCKHHKKGNLNPCWKGYEEISGKYWESLRHGAERRKLDFNISIEYVWKLFLKQDRKCSLTGIILNFSKGSGKWDGNASLDRIDSSKGYIEGNVQWVDKKVNTIKWDLSVDNFLKICKMVVEYKKL